MRGKFLSKFSPHPQELELDKLLMALHCYFMSLGVDEIRKRGALDEKSLRMVKTLVHELCKIMARPSALHP